MRNPLGTLAERWTLVAGRPVFARVSVDPTPPGAAPVVLVHGFAISGRSLEPTARRLARDHPTYVPDLPGFGRSVRPERVPAIPELAEALAEWMTAVGLERAVLLGHSMGCQVIAELAQRAPGMVERAILVGPSGQPQVSGPIEQIGRLALDGLREPFGLVRIALADYLRFGPRRALRLLREVNRHPMDDRLRGLTAPTLLVVGERDPIFPVELARRQVGSLPCGRLAVVPGAAHAVPYSAPDHVVRLIRDFLATEGSCAPP